MASLVVLYPQPTNVAKFEADYAKHIDLLHKKTGIPINETPYTVTRFQTGADGSPPPYYQMFAMPFDTLEGLQHSLSSAEMQAVAADAGRISSGGAPVMLLGD